MKVLMFDFRESEKEFFKTNNFADFEIKFFEEPLNSKTKLSEEDLDETDILCVYRTSVLSEKVLKQFKNLTIVATRSFGFSHIDLDYCRKNNISVFHVEQYGEDAVSEYSLGLIIALTRHMRPALLGIKNHQIDPKKYEGKMLNRLSIGIIGCGKVGEKLGKLANQIGMRVYVSSYKETPHFAEYCNVVPFDKLLSESDIIAIHMPYTTEPYQIITENEFDKMKQGVFIINTSSVDFIDIKALNKNLLSGKIKGAGLDILDTDFVNGKAVKLGDENKNTKENNKVISKLLKMPNVIITPHIAYNTIDTINYVLETTFNNIRDCKKGMNTNRVC